MRNYQGNTQWTRYHIAKFLKLLQSLRANKQHGLDELQQSEYINCLENCTQKAVLSVSLSKWIDALNELLQDSVVDLVQLNFFIKDLDKIGSMLTRFADEAKVRQRLY